MKRRLTAAGVAVALAALAAGPKWYRVYRQGDISGVELRRGGTMKRTLTTAGVAVALTVLATAPTWGTIGSVISSFVIPGSEYAYGIYAEPTNLYLSGNLTYGNYILTYTRSGTLLRSRSIDPGNDYSLYCGSRTHLGPGYIGLIDRHLNRFKIFSIANGGAPVASLGMLENARTCFWNGEYYFLNLWDGKGLFWKYTSSGSMVGSWTCTGWPTAMQYCGGVAYAQYGNHAAGPYFIASEDYSHSDPCCMTTFPGGSLISTWRVPLPSGHVAHLSYGDSSNPGTYGAAVWALLHSPYYVVEFDIDARNASSVVPASVGKIRAIYR